MAEQGTECRDMRRDHNDNHRQAGRWAGRVMACVVLAWMAFAGVWIWDTWVEIRAPGPAKFNATKAGQFGDTFGAINALFSGLALAGVVYAVMLQRVELEIAWREVSEGEEARKKTDELMRKQAETMRVTAEINALGAIANATMIHYNTIVSSGRHSPEEAPAMKKQFDQCLARLREIQGGL